MPRLTTVLLLCCCVAVAHAQQYFVPADGNYASGTLPANGYVRGAPYVSTATSGVGFQAGSGISGATIPPLISANGLWTLKWFPSSTSPGWVIFRTVLLDNSQGFFDSFQIQANTDMSNVMTSKTMSFIQWKCNKQGIGFDFGTLPSGTWQIFINNVDRVWVANNGQLMGNFMTVGSDGPRGIVASDWVTCNWASTVNHYRSNADALVNYQINYATTCPMTVLPSELVEQVSGGQKYTVTVSTTNSLTRSLSLSKSFGFEFSFTESASVEAGVLGAKVTASFSSTQTTTYETTQVYTEDKFSSFTITRELSRESTTNMCLYKTASVRTCQYNALNANMTISFPSGRVYTAPINEPFTVRQDVETYDLQNC